MFKQVRFALSVLLNTLVIPISIVISIIISIVTSTTSLALAATVGLTPGQFRVDESGAATYTLPINTPEGRAGVTPQVSLAYSSNHLATGPLGVGWSLTGLSSISRCPQTPIHDNGHIQEVRFTDEDKFCLDGQRLILKSGTYGADGSTYHTEIDNFSTITARGRAYASGPLYFVIKNKAGETHYYGDASYAHNASGRDAFIEPGGSESGGVARSWAISVIEDVKHNYIVFNYQKNTEVGSFYIDNIQYAGNSAQRDTPYAEVDFIYAPYDRGARGYLSGAYAQQTQLLTRIDTKIDTDIGREARGKTYRSYFIEYESALNTASVEDRPLITQIQECTDVDQRNCLPATVFDWQRPSLSSGGRPFNRSNRLASGTDNESTAQIFDINGDGVQDIVYADNGAWWAKLGPAHGRSVKLSAIGDENHPYALTIDYNGDGIRELLVASNKKKAHWTTIGYKAKSTQTLCAKNKPCTSTTYRAVKSVVDLGIQAIGLKGEAQVMDIDGDGLEDIVYRDGDSLKVYLNNNGKFSKNTTLYRFKGELVSYSSYAAYETQTASMKSTSGIDINGDGRSDIISKITSRLFGCYLRGVLLPDVIQGRDCADNKGQWGSRSSTNYVLLVSTGKKGNYALTKQQTIGNADKIENLRVVDLNGDGLSDVIYVIEKEWYYRLSDGTQLLEQRSTHLSTKDSLKLLSQFVDLNGDGRTDILHATSKTRWSIYYTMPSSEGEALTFKYRGSKSFSKNATIRFGDTNGDGKVDLLTAKGSNWTEHTNRKGIKDYVIKTITNGHGINTHITYKPMTNKSVYIFQSSDNHLNSDTFSPMSGMQLVSRVETDSKSTAKVAVTYQYGGLLIHKKGRGSLGFQMLRTIDEQSGVVSETRYHQDYSKRNFAKARMPLYSEQRLNGKLLSSSMNIWSVNGTRQGGVSPYIRVSKESRYIIGSDGYSTKVSQTATINRYDGWGNLISNAVTITDSATSKEITTITTNRFGNRTEQQFGRLKSTSVKKTRSGERGSHTRKSTFTYNRDNLLHSSIVSPNASATKLKTSYNYDKYGNKTSVSVTGYVKATGTNQTRTSTSQYDKRGRYLKYQENALGERVTYQYNGKSADSVTGLISKISQTGPNGLTSTTSVNAFNQVTATKNPKNITTTISQTFCNGRCSVSGAYYSVKKTTPRSAAKEVFYDKWGREIAARVQGFNGSWSVRSTHYDNQGRQLRVSEPNSSRYFTEFEYDKLGRVTQITRPNNSFVNQTVDGLTRKTTNELGQVSYVVSNGFGETAKTEDALGNTVTFTYDRYGNLTKSTTTADSKSSSISASYDNWGRKTKTIDPIKGTWTYTYNAFGELTSQKTARGHTFTFDYDKLGRKIRSYQSNEGTLCWTYGSSNMKSKKAVGKLIKTAKYAGKNVSCKSSSTPTIKKEFTYNTVGLSKDVTTTLNNQRYKQSVSYNRDLRPEVITYPTGQSAFAVKNIYNRYGYLVAIKNNRTNKVLKTINRMNDRGQVIKQTFGTGTTTTYNYRNDNGWLNTITVKKASQVINSLSTTHDDLGNVTSRTSDYSARNGSGSHYMETYGYDELNRLTERDISVSSGHFSLPATFKESQTYSFDGWGNFTFKTGAGYYKYDSTKVHKLLGVYSSAARSSRNALYTFTYDKNGNTTKDGNRSFTYASFDKPTFIKNNDASSSMKYGVSRELYYKEDTTRENGKTTTHKTTYLGNYEKVVRTGGAGNLTEHKYYVGEFIVTQRSNGSTDTFYLHKDHQGSVIVTTNATGKVITQAIYDPFGKRSEIYVESLLANFSPLAPTDRGYTGHKQLKALDIIHMKGRIYDPTLGRFLQADPIIQEPNNSQSYNRYSYVINNPLSLTDPTGYFFSGLKKLVKKYWKVVVAAVVVYFTAGAASGWVSTWGATWGTAATATSAATLTTAGSMAVGAMAGAAGGFVGGALATGSFTGALKGAVVGAFSGAAFGGVNGYYGDTWNMSRVGATSLAGGASSKVAGGNFANGVKFAFAAAMMRYGYNKAMNYDATWSKGRGLASPDGTYLESEGVPNGPIVFGTNTSPLTGDTWGDFFKQGGSLSTTANNLPGMNSLAKLHDWMQIGFDRIAGSNDSMLRAVMNVPAMIPATVMNYGALMTDLQLATSINNSEWMRRNNG